MLPRLDAKARRFGEIDLMKATAIVMAVWAHSMTLGPYCFIYILIQFVVCTWFLSRLPVAVQWFVLAAAAVALAALTLHSWPFAKPWETRTVARWGVWFLLGWFARRHYAPIRELCERAPVPILCVALGVFASAPARRWQVTRSS